MEKPASVRGEKFSTDFILAIAFVIVIFVIGTYCSGQAAQDTFI